MSNWRDPQDSDYKLPSAKNPHLEELSTAVKTDLERLPTKKKPSISISLVYFIVSLIITSAICSTIYSRLSVEIKRNEENSRALTNKIADLHRDLAELKSKTVPDIAPYLTKDAVIAELLKKSPNWRAAEVSDNNDPLSQRIREQNPTYNPYYAEGDLNQDGVKDFVRLITTMTADKGKVFYILGTSKGYEKAEPAAIAQEIHTISISISNGNLQIKGKNTTYEFIWDREAKKLIQNLP